MVFDFLWNFFQDSATPIMEGIINLHNYIFIFLCLISIFVIVMLYNIYRVSYKIITKPKNLRMLKFRYLVINDLHVTHGRLLEIIWTVLPALILVVIALPSFFLLYAMDEIIKPSMTLRVVGYQWYWSYHYLAFDNCRLFSLDDFGRSFGRRNFYGINFDSNIINELDLRFGAFRLLEVDRVTLLPIYAHIRIVVTANDVLHSWALPALGIKMDAVPGRLNQFPTFIRRRGIFYGQCSELCGPSHGFMPICLVACLPLKYVVGTRRSIVPLPKPVLRSSFELNYFIQLFTLANSLLFLSVFALLKRRNTLINFVIILELLLLAINIYFVTFAFWLNDLLGLLFSFCY